MLVPFGPYFGLKVTRIPASGTANHSPLRALATTCRFGNAAAPGKPSPMHTAAMQGLSESWVDGRLDLRWRSTVGTSPENGARASGTSLLEVDPGCALPRHTDSAEETVVVVSGTAAVQVGDESATVPAGGVALVPQDVPHQVRNAGDGPLRFVAVYAAADVVTRYEDEVQPDGGRERQTIG
jgi:quercetin dioxygenase-like cupin family protein